jgi:cardiolipin synthase
LLLTAIYLAKRELIIATPYFVPDDSVLTALTSAALRGVAVTLIVPERNNSWLVQYASAACFDGLIEAGVSVLQFTRGLLHTKCMTVDGVTGMFGSVNFDMRSLWLNSEISLFIYDREATAELRAMQLSYMSACKRIDPKVWSQRSMRQRWTENVLRLIGPLL